MWMDAGLAEAAAGAGELGEIPPGVDGETSAGETDPRGDTEVPAAPDPGDDAGPQAAIANIAAHRIAARNRSRPVWCDDDLGPWVVNKERVTAGTVQHIPDA